MKLLKIAGILVAVLGLAALALVVAPAMYTVRSARAFAQERPRDEGPGRPPDTGQEWRRWELTGFGRGAGIGVRVADTDGGVVIEAVDVDGAADKAGLKRSDVIVEFDGERVRSARQFGRLVQETGPGHAVRATVTRDGQRKEVTITADAGRGVPMVSGELRDYMRDLGRDLGRLGERLPFNFDFDVDLAGPISGRRLGVTVQQLTPQLADYFGAQDGVLVTNVAEGSAAARAGLKAGDVIASINGARVATRQALLRGLRDASGDEISVGIVRDKKEMTVQATVERPARRVTRGSPA